MHRSVTVVMAHPLFGPEVRLMLQENDAGGMEAFCETLHPATVAEALADEFAVEEVWRFLQHTSIRNQAAIFEYFPLDWQVQMVEGTGRQQMARLIEQMSSRRPRRPAAPAAAAVRREPAAPGGRGRPPRHRHAGPVPGEHRRRADDHRLRLAAGQHHRRRGARPAAPAGPGHGDDLLRLRPRRPAPAARRGVAARPDPGPAARACSAT